MIMAKITKVWFEGGRIYIATNDGKTYSRPLEYFPILKEATDDQREAWKINKFGDAIRWEEIDEDIHLSSFYATDEPDTNNGGCIPSIPAVECVGDCPHDRYSQKFVVEIYLRHQKTI